MPKLLSSVVCVCLFTLACDKTTPLFLLPTTRTDVPAPPAPAAAPQPRPFSPFEYTEITVGQPFTGRVSAEPPECVELPGWPCQYFRLTAPSNGTLIVELQYNLDTQPGGQGVDVSIYDGQGREVWADYFEPTLSRTRIVVTEGTVYQITFWYTFPDLEFELQSSLQPG